MPDCTFVFYEGEQVLLTYNKGCIQRSIVFNKTGEILFYPKEGEEIRVNVKQYVRPDIVYLKQFGLSITADGKLFFVQSWNKGLFCFEVHTGLLVWHNERKNAYRLALSEESVVCMFMDQCVDKIAIETGEVLAHHALGEGEVFLRIAKESFLVGPRKKCYYILDSNLHAIGFSPVAEINPYGYDTFIILTACFTKEGMLISGYEYARDDVINQQKSHRLKQMEENLFYREVKVYELE